MDIWRIYAQFSCAYLQASIFKWLKNWGSRQFGGVKFWEGNSLRGQKGDNPTKHFEKQFMVVLKSERVNLENCHHIPPSKRT